MIKVSVLFWDLVEIGSLLGQGLGLGLGLDTNFGIMYMYKIEGGSLFVLLIVNLHSTGLKAMSTTFEGTDSIAVTKFV